MEESISIDGVEVRLEGRYQAGQGPGGVVIAHPHPLYGGDLDDNVVWIAARAFQFRGWATLRFNFRGVGLSTGHYGEGLAEADDVAQALAWLKGRVPGPHVLVGYSFGAAVTARALWRGLAADGAVLISPPIAFMDLGFLTRVPGVRLVVAGDQDALCPLADLRELIRQWQAADPRPGEHPSPELEVVPQTDHFFAGREKRLFEILAGYEWT
ncbi:MAG: alpha/beta hydrolase [Deltaproteobacteria bacterium]|nr:alpha/beta hydrolase [Deltaproteobacteria bacterium]MBM4286114.1 alpha/beta hydrolase [Deltaproteobacteria bacterium]